MAFAYSLFDTIASLIFTAAMDGPLSWLLHSPATSLLYPYFCGVELTFMHPTRKFKRNHSSRLVNLFLGMATMQCPSLQTRGIAILQKHSKSTPANCRACAFSLLPAQFLRRFGHKQEARTPI